MRTELQNLPEPQWFHHGERILELIEDYRPKHCVELGTYRGGSAIATARVVRRWGGDVFCVDHWEGDAMEECQANLQAAGVANVVWLVRAQTGDLASAWAKLDRQPIDIDYLYVDADHTYDGCFSDLELWWPFLKVGGLIAGDDYDDPHGIPAIGVTAAWDAFEAKRDQAFVREVSLELIGCQCERCRNGRLIWGVKR